MKKSLERIFCNDLTIQIFMTLSMFLGLTGAAFIIGSEWLKPFRDLQRFLSYALIAGCAAVAWWRYHKERNSFFELEPVRTIKAFFDMKPIFSVSFLFVLYASMQIIYQMVTHAAMETALWDLGFYDQIIWNTAHGHFLITSVRGGLHVFCEHFKPIIALLAPIYSVTNNTNLLFVLFSSLNATIVISTYLIAKFLTRSHYTALILAICVFFYQPCVNAINFLLHTQVLADPLILIAFYCILRKRTVIGILFFVLALGCKENIAIDVFGVGLFLIFRRQKGGWIVALLALTTLMTYALNIEPNFRYPYHFIEKANAYSHLLTWKLDEWRRLLQPNPIFFLFLIFGPFAFLTFRCRGWYLLLGPSILFRLLIAWANFRTITYHYTGGFNALVFISTIYGVASYFKASEPEIRVKAGSYTFLPGKWLRNEPILQTVLLLSIFLFVGTPQLFKIDKYLAESSDRPIQKIATILDSTPSNYSILASERLSAHLSHRSYLFVFQSMFPKAPYEEMAAKPDLIFVDRERINASEKQALDHIVVTGYDRVFNFSFLDVFVKKDISKSPAFSAVLAHWKLIASSRVTDYRKIGRILYMLMLVLAATTWFVTTQRKRAIK